MARDTFRFTRTAQGNAIKNRISPHRKDRIDFQQQHKTTIFPKPLP
jgi:hypothetical protein